MIATGVVLLLAGAWVSASLVRSAGHRRDVLAVAREVDRFELITADDLRVVRVATDPDVDTVPADQADDLVGRAAATDLIEGALLSPAQVVSPGDRLVADSESVVGALLTPSDAPAGSLVGGVDLLVVLRPAVTQSELDVRAVPAWLLRAGDPDENTGDQSVELVVADSEAAAVASAAADKRLSIVTQGG
jgi:hypothetical protein